MIRNRKCRASLMLPGDICDPIYTRNPLLQSISDMVDHDLEQNMAPVQDDLMNRIEAMLDRKLEPISAKLAEVVRNYDYLNDQLQGYKGEVQYAVSQQGETIKELMTETSCLRIRDNVVQQRDRDPSFIISNFSVPDKITPVELSKKLHNDLFKPMFIEAAKQGMLPVKETVHLDELDDGGEPVVRASREVELPGPLDLIEYCHVLPGGDTKGRRPENMPPGVEPRRSARIQPLIVKIRSRNFKSIIHKFKKNTIEKYNRDKQLNEFDQVFMVDDITKVNRFCLNKLKKTDEVEEAFWLGGKIRFRLKNKPNKTFIVHNPYAPNLEQLTVRPRA